MSILTHIEIDTETRDSYLQAEHASRRLLTGDYTGRDEDKARDTENAARMETPEFQALHDVEEFILTVTEDGYGKRSSAFEYRISGRGGQGITAISLDRGEGEDAAQVVASFGVTDADQVILVTNGGQIIRTPVDQVSIIGRGARGVRLFNVGDDERVVSVSRVSDAVDDDEDLDGEEGEDGAVAAAAGAEDASVSDDAAPEAPDAESEA